MNSCVGLTPLQKQAIYDELQMVLERYEESDDDESELMHGMLLKIYANWDDIITA